MYINDVVKLNPVFYSINIVHLIQYPNRARAPCLRPKTMPGPPKYPFLIDHYSSAEKRIFLPTFDAQIHK